MKTITKKELLEKAIQSAQKAGYVVIKEKTVRKEKITENKKMEIIENTNNFTVFYNSETKKGSIAGKTGDYADKEIILDNVKTIIDTEQKKYPNASLDSILHKIFRKNLKKATSSFTMVKRSDMLGEGKIINKSIFHMFAHHVNQDNITIGDNTYNVDEIIINDDNITISFDDYQLNVKIITKGINKYSVEFNINEEGNVVYKVYDLDDLLDCLEKYLNTEEVLEIVQQ